VRIAWLFAVLCLAAGPVAAQNLPSSAAIDAEAQRIMAETGARGLAIAVIDDGQVVSTQAWGVRNAAGDPLMTDTVMYSASLTKPVFAWMVMQMVGEGLIDLDAPLSGMFPRPLPDYREAAVRDRWGDWTAMDESWRQLTPRILLTHSGGFAAGSDGRLRFRNEPGMRYAYSGPGLILLQFALFEEMGVDLETEARTRVFEPFGMVRTGLVWRDSFSGNVADGWTRDGTAVAHRRQSRANASASMDTTLEDFARFAAAYVSGEGLSERARIELTRAQRPITTASQFPVDQPELPPDQRRPDLAAGLGIVVFDGPQGPGFIKGGQNSITANTWVCLERSRRCVVILSNDARAEPAFEGLVRFILGETGAPYGWEYGGQA
jgi:CubicO group peptidase (beta-lactamase class C family)